MRDAAKEISVRFSSGSAAARSFWLLSAPDGAAANKCGNIYAAGEAKVASVAIVTNEPNKASQQIRPLSLSACLFTLFSFITNLVELEVPVCHASDSRPAQ